MEDSKLAVLILLILCGLLIISIYIIYQYYILPIKSKLSLYKYDLKYLNKKFEMKIGTTKLYDNKDLEYCLITMDSGVDWYAFDNIDYKRYNRVIILGKAEVISPGLLKYLKELDNFTKANKLTNSKYNENNLKDFLDNLGLEINKKPISIENNES